jgi:hypothetical protein
MTWGYIGGAAVGVVGNALLNSNKGSSQTAGGAGTTTDTKAPWAAAQPWIQQNMAQGQALQNQYANQPFNLQQQQAFNNQYAQSDYMRQLVPSLLSQMQGQPVGFNRADPTAKPAAWNWGLSGSGSGANLGLGGADAVGSMQAAQAAQAAADAAAKKKPSGDFTQFNGNPMAGYYAAFMSPETMSLMTDQGKGVKSAFQSALGDAGGAGYGAFKYGSAMPEKGTQAYRDMNEYFNYGGNDPYNLYGRAPSASATVPVNLGMT